MLFLPELGPCAWCACLCPVFLLVAGVAGGPLVGGQRFEACFVYDQHAAGLAVHGTELDEVVEEYADARAGRPDHRGELFLRDAGVDGEQRAVLPADLAGQVQQDGREAVLAVHGDELGDQLLLLKQPLSQVLDELFPHAIVVEQGHEARLRDPPQNRRRHGGEAFRSVQVAEAQLPDDVTRGEDALQALLALAGGGDERRAGRLGLFGR
jgi:hypothetical protein